MTTSSRLLAVTLALLPVTTSAAPATGGDAAVRTKLYQTSRARLALAYAQGRRDFNVLIASRAGRNAEVARAISAAGGTVLQRADDLDYLRATIPIGKVESIVERDDVETADADAPTTTLNVTPPPGATPSSGSSAAPSPTPHARTAADEHPLLHPYVPGNDIGTLRLRAAHPAFDGRGVTVALIDGTPDFLLPELQRATTASGATAPKFLDIVTAEDPNDPNEYSPWLALRTTVDAADGTFVVDGKTYHAPHPGAFRFTVVHANGGYGKFASLVDPGAKDVAGAPLFAVLWDPRSNTVWIDTRRDGDFRDAAPLTDYAVGRGSTTFPVKTKDPQARPSLGVVVQTDRVDGKVALLFGDANHGTMTAGSIAANSEGGGLVTGIAPGASILSISPGDGTNATIIAAAIRAARDPRVSALCFEIISALSYALKDGRYTESVVLDRIAERYGKAVLFPADNDFGMSRVSEACIPAHVTCVNAYESADSYRTNAGILVAHRDNLHFVGAFGPAGNGALEPTFLAPSGYLSLVPAFHDVVSYSARPGVYNLRPGYSIGGGTSQATPTGAAATAILFGAARASGIAVTPQFVKAAMERTARYLPGIPAYEQGGGLVQVDAAYAWLAHHRGGTLPTITFDAPVHTAISRFLRTPNRGPGLFLREGVTTGAAMTQTIWASTSEAAPERLAVALEGNDGTFSTSAGVVLRRGIRTPIAIAIDAKTDGAHSAILRLRSRDGDLVGETLVTVVAGAPFTRANGYRVARRILAPRPGTTSLFVTVPVGAQALVVGLTSPRAKLSFRPLQPDGGDPANLSNNLLTGFMTVAGTTQFVFPRPQPGTWELELIDANDTFQPPPRLTHVLPTPITLDAAIVQEAVIRGGAGVAWKSLGAQVAGLSATRVLAQRASMTGALPLGGQRAYDLHVSADAVGIAASLTSRGTDRLNLYLFRCDPLCLIVDKSTADATRQALSVDAPKAGHWKLVVDGYAGSAGPMSYRLTTDVVEGVPRALPGRTPVPAIELSVLGDDPSVYYNEGPHAGPITPRTGLNPFPFDLVPIP